MKKLVFLLLLIAGIGGLMIGVWSLVTSDNTVTADSGARHELYRRAKTRVEQYADKFKDGGGYIEFSNARGFIEGRREVLSSEEIELLRDGFATGVLENLHERIKDLYTPAMVAGTVESLPTLRDAYRNLDTLAANFPSVRPSEKFRQLDKARKALNAAYLFKQKNHPESARMQPSLSYSAPNFSLNYKMPLDYDAYTAQTEALRSKNLMLWREANLLSGVKWIPRALDESESKTRIAASRKNYQRNEAIALKNFLASQSSTSNPYLFADDTSREALKNLSQQTDDMIKAFTTKYPTLPSDVKSELQKANEIFHDNLALSARRF